MNRSELCTCLLDIAVGVVVGVVLGMSLGGHRTETDLIERGVCVWSVDPQTGERELVANCDETENTDAD